jgi:CheY-like chemotaxis protein
MRILVVDDNAEFLKAARFLLRQLGHEPVGLARDGDEGLALAVGLRPDVVLVEVEPPGMAGLETVARMKSLDAGPPVVVITRGHDAAVQRRCLEAGCDGFVPKGDLAADLPRVLARLAGTHVQQTTARSNSIAALECADV